MENKKSLKEIVVSTVNSLKSVIDVTEVVGEPIKIGKDEVLIPISRLTIGFGIGGSELQRPELKNDLLFEYSSDSPLAGGGLGGLSLNPEAFLYFKNGEMEVVRMKENKNIYDRLFEVYKDVTKYLKNNKKT